MSTALTVRSIGLRRGPRRAGIIARSIAVIGALLAFGAIADSAAAPPTKADWPMFRGNSGLTGVAGTTLGKELRVRWKFDAGEAVTSSAAIVEETAYVGADDGTLYALDLRTGDVRWKYKTEEAIRSSPAVTRGLVIFGDSEGILHGVSATTGEKKWTYATGGEIVSSPNPKGATIPAIS